MVVSPVKFVIADYKLSILFIVLLFSSVVHSRYCTHTIQTLLSLEKQKVKAIHNITDPEVDELHTASAEEKSTHSCNILVLCSIGIIRKTILLTN